MLLLLLLSLLRLWLLMLFLLLVVVVVVEIVVVDVVLAALVVLRLWLRLLLRKDLCAGAHETATSRFKVMWLFVVCCRLQ